MRQTCVMTKRRLAPGTIGARFGTIGEIPAATPSQHSNSGPSSNLRFPESVDLRSHLPQGKVVSISQIRPLERFNLGLRVQVPELSSHSITEYALSLSTSVASAFLGTFVTPS